MYSTVKVNLGTFGRDSKVAAGTALGAGCAFAGVAEGASAESALNMLVEGSVFPTDVNFGAIEAPAACSALDDPGADASFGPVFGLGAGLELEVDDAKAGAGPAALDEPAAGFRRETDFNTGTADGTPDQTGKPNGPAVAIFRSIFCPYVFKNSSTSKRKPSFGSQTWVLRENCPQPGHHVFGAFLHMPQMVWWQQGRWTA